MKRFCCFLASALLLLSSFSTFATGVSGEAEHHFYIRRALDHAPATTDPAFEAAFGDRALYRDKAAHSAGERRIYLTFDAGYENGNVAKILDILEKENVRGSFFVLSHLIKSAPELVLRMEKEGHLVCNHTAHHKNMARLGETDFCAELSALEEAYHALTGKKMAGFYRPPEGSFSVSNLAWAEKMGYKTVFWSLAYCDWNDSVAPKREKAIEILKKNTHMGAIVLLHPTSDINVSILGEMIEYWKGEGYTFHTLSEVS